MLDDERDSILLAQSISALIFTSQVKFVISKHAEDFLVILFSEVISKTDKVVLI